MEYIAFDAHKHYTLASVARPDGRLVRANDGWRMSGERSSSFWRTVSRAPRSRWRRSALVLDRRRDRAGRLSPQARARAQGEADDGADQQDG
jgi:hypothetical protein